MTRLKSQPETVVRYNEGFGQTDANSQFINVSDRYIVIIGCSAGSSVSTDIIELTVSNSSAAVKDDIVLRGNAPTYLPKRLLLASRDVFTSAKNSGAYSTQIQFIECDSLESALAIL